MLIPLIVTACSASDPTSQGASCTGPKTYAPGSTVTGATAGGNCMGPDGSLGQLYSMTVAQQTNIQLTLAATGFPGYLGLYTSSGDVITANNTDLKFKAFVPPGTYQIFVNSVTGQDGTFTLTSPSVGLDGCSNSAGNTAPADLGFTVIGASLDGTVTALDCGNSLSKTDIYALRLKAGAVLTVSITVDRVSGLSVNMGKGPVLASKEMPAGGTWTSTVTAPATGEYLVHVESRTVNGSSNLPVVYSVLLR